MNIEQFYSKISHAVSGEPSLLSSKNIVKNTLEEILADKSTDAIIKMTRMTVLFEGFYQSIQANTEFKKKVLNIRMQRWANHYGTPTLNFLLTFDGQIKNIAASLQNTWYLRAQLSISWTLKEQIILSHDLQNNVLVNEKASAHINTPPKEERTGKLIKTYNLSGGYVTLPEDIYSQKFLAYSKELAKNKGQVLEVGAAFGAASLKAVEQGVTVFCNDIYSQNLAVIRNRYIKSRPVISSATTGDSNQLIFLPGAFPEELSALPGNFFDAVLISRVLHFFTGDQIEKSLEQVYGNLKPGGKLFIICETPFRKNWKRFIPEYEQRLRDGVKWPGEITNPSDYKLTRWISSLPGFVHWISKDILERALIHAHFKIEHISYIDRAGQFPVTLLLDGRESVGALVHKPF